MVLRAGLASTCRIYSREVTNWSPCDHVVMSVDDLAKKKRVRAGHKASATHMIGSAEDLLATAGSDTSKPYRSVADEIEQADTFKEGIYSTMVKIVKYCAPSLALPTDYI